MIIFKINIAYIYGLELDREKSKDIDDYKYTIEESEIGYKNFCVIENLIYSIPSSFINGLE